MSSGTESDASAKIIAVVLDLLHSDGYEAVQLRVVAARAHVSLAKIYRLFRTRDELIIAALQQWMEANAYADIAPIQPGETLRESLLRILRTVFEPWERNPEMLVAYHHARTGPGGERLDNQGMIAVLPVAEVALRDLDPRYLEDLGLIMGNMALALIGRFATGTLPITEILSTLERTAYRMTADNAAAARRKAPAPR
ncbi:TetR family transcriptional regulator [Nocardia mangyaensis]|uniref:TetR family transcriptional regulator n=1 Tax=Nocardia mangyaensis TaxID=2213200 RepID=UPI00267759C1|nr:TetR family transcriptional regulator [Nocardia mangyaensis]MDO3648175.1 TetR family transcriptional regulator [Nocardia mangyaensis]